MIQAHPNTPPEGRGQCDQQRLNHITGLVEKKPAPLYQEIPLWREFLRFLSSRQAFLTSDHNYPYLNTLAALLQNSGGIKNKTIAETACASPKSLYLTHHNKCYSAESERRLNLDAESEFAGTVISPEELEQIKNPPEKALYNLKLFHESGAKCYALKMYRITQAVDLWG